MHTVYLDRFYIDRYETTNAEYVEFLNALGHISLACDGVTCADLRPANVYQYEFPSRILMEDSRFLVEKGYENYPVAAVTWEGADAYCRWRGKQLPTSAQWEKAARGIEGRIRPWGNKWEPNKCAEKAMPVGSYPSDVSPYVVFDMACSVNEWMSDWADPNYYSYSPRDNPLGPEQPAEFGYRIIRPNVNNKLDSPSATKHDATRDMGVRCVYSPEP